VREVHEGVDGDDAGREAWAEVVIVPALWMLALGVNTRIFQQESVPEIAVRVLTEALLPYGRVLRPDVTRPYPRREYCVQYQESDLDFVHRLFEEEGISYSFEHHEPTELLVLHDRNEHFVPVDTYRAAGTSARTTCAG
jgi:type VI secretion system secreted protein VgrG